MKSIFRTTTLFGTAFCVLAGCNSHQQPPQDETRPVRVLAVSQSSEATNATYSGEIRARYETNLAFKVSGKVTERLVDVGSHVARGQALMRLDPQDAVLSATAAAAQTEAARIRLAQSRADLERYERLFSEQFVSEATLDQYKLTYETAKSLLQSAQAQEQMSENQRRYTVLTADRAGVVTAIDIEVGHVISAGQSVLTVAADGEREVLVSIPESRVEDFHGAQDVSVSTWADPQHVYAAALRELAPDTDKETRTYAARISILRPDDAIRLGMTASVHVSHAASATAVHVPLSALLYQRDRASVWVVDPEALTVAPRQITLAATQKDNVVVADGLHDGDVIVTAGVHMLHAGQKVKPLLPEIIVGSAQ